MFFPEELYAHRLLIDVTRVTLLHAFFFANSVNVNKLKLARSGVIPGMNTQGLLLFSVLIYQFPHSEWGVIEVQASHYLP